MTSRVANVVDDDTLLLTGQRTFDPTDLLRGECIGLRRTGKRYDLHVRQVEALARNLARYELQDLALAEAAEYGVARIGRSFTCDYLGRHTSRTECCGNSHAALHIHAEGHAE